MRLSRFDAQGRERLGMSEQQVRDSLYETPRWRRLLVMAAAVGLAPQIKTRRCHRQGLNPHKTTRRSR